MIFCLMTSIKVHSSSIYILMFPGSEFSIMFNELMYLAITPNMEAITGFVESHAFYTTMIKIIDKSKVKFSKLKSMAHPRSTFPDYISHFRCYKRLTWLKLQGSITSIGYLMTTIDQLISLKVSTLSISCPNLLLSRVDTAVRSKSFIRQCNKFKLLRIESWCTPNLLNFVLYKFPNLEGITLDIGLTAASPNISFYRIAQLMALGISVVSSVGMRAEKVALLRLQGFQP